MTEAAKHAQMRAEFERYFSGDGATPAAIERSGEGYRLMQAQASWVTWQFCWDRRATPAPAQPEVDVRKAFEAWAVTQWFAIHRNGGEQYVNTATQHAWNGWKGASEAQAAAPAEGAASLAQLQYAHAAGFKLASNWMERDDLIADVHSPAYVKDRNRDLAAAPKEKP